MMELSLVHLSDLKAFPRNNYAALVASLIFITGCSTSEQPDTARQQTFKALAAGHKPDHVMTLSERGQLTQHLIVSAPSTQTASFMATPPYSRNVPQQSAACKSLVAQGRNVSLDLGTVQVIAATGEKPWGIYRFDVSNDGSVSNVREINVKGAGAASSAFKSSIRSWVFKSNQPTKNCVAELKIR